MPLAIHKFPVEAGSPETYFLPEEKRVEGNPQQSLWIHYSDPSGRFLAGVWYSEVGKWRIAYTEEEYCQILEGVSVLTDRAGMAVTVTAGESFVVPRGFVGTWEVVVPTRKLFALYDIGEPLAHGA